MIQRLVAAALRMRAIVFSMVVVVIIGGLAAYHRLDIEAYPNPCPPLVEIIVQPTGWSAEEVERYVTIPMEIGVAGMKGLDHVRSQSLFELSDIKCYFKWGFDYWAVRQEVINRLQFVQLPNSLTASLSPWNAIGEVYRYTLKGKGYTVRDMKTAEDWIMERQWRQVDGVVDVTSFGGETKEYHVEVDPFRLKGQGVTLLQVTTAIGNGNQNVGGGRVVIGEQSYNIRGIGLLKNVHDIENIVVAEMKGVPVRVRDVANVNLGYAPRLGVVGHDDEDDVVQGVVLMRYDGETPSTLEGVHARVERIRNLHLLPPGMELIPYYDRGKLVALTTHTVIENLVIGMTLVVFTLLLFLGNVRAALITALNIPVALLIAFIGMVASGTSANLLSIGAVDFGIVIDSTVIMMENIFRHIGAHGKGTMPERILAGAREVGGPMTFSTLIIGAAFLPLFTMTGVSGVIFGPMARTYAFAIGGAIFMALTLTPVLAAQFIPANAEEKEVFLMRMLHKAYNPFFDAALKHPKTAAGIGLVPILACVVLYPLLGGEFMPKLEEGNFWIRATLPTSISLQQSSLYTSRMRRILRGCPDDMKIACTDANRSEHGKIVETVVSQLGRPDDGTDVAQFNNIEFFAPLKPFDDWPRGVDKPKLTAEMQGKLQEAFPGVVFNFSQYISDNVEEALSGVKGENSVKILGPDVVANEKNADAIMEVMSHVPGVADLGVFHSLGQPNVRIVPDRAACARYGLNTGDIDAVISAAVGGQSVTNVYEGEKNFALTVRWLEPFRKSVESIREITVATPDGNFIPLGQLATITLEDGPNIIFREDGFRYAPVKFSVRGRDLKSTIEDAKKQIAASPNVHLSYDTHLEWAGQINEMNDAMQRLLIIIPLTLVLIGFLTYTAVKSWMDTLVVFSNIPVACTGGVLALLLTGTNFSVSAAMGFVSIFGIAIQDAILVVTYFQRLRDVEQHSIIDAAREAAEKRFRPVLMTTLVATLGLAPAALSNGIGSQAQKPLAVVVIGGSLILAILTRVLQPPLLVMAHEWMERRKGGPPADPLPLSDIQHS